MALHEFMLPEVVASRPAVQEMKDKQLPSALFVGVDPHSSVALLKEGLFDVNPPEELDKLTSVGYKHWRRQYAFQRPFSEMKSTFFIDFEDACYMPRETSFGRDFNVFQYNRRRGDLTSVLWRLPNYFEPSRGIGHPPRNTERDAIDFADKLPKIFWRGGISGVHWSSPEDRKSVPRITNENIGDKKLWNKFSRLKAVFSLNDLEIVDAKFAGNTVESFVDSGLRGLGHFTDAVPANEMMKYRYLLCPAGNDVSSSLYWVIRTNSVAFKEETQYETVPDYFLKPWVHYVPVSPGLTDLKEKYEYCERNLDFCKWLVGNANRAYRRIVDSTEWEDAENIVLDRLGLM